MVSLKNVYEKNVAPLQCDIVNANVRKVNLVLERLVHDDRYGMCRCQHCCNDIAALALNYLPPHYYVDAGRGGDIGSPLVMVESAVLEAAERVRMNPHHHRT